MTWIWAVGLIKVQLKIVGEKSFFHHQWGRIKSLLNTDAAEGDFKNTHRDELPIYHSQVFTSLLLSSSFCLFAGKNGRCKVNAGTDIFMAPAHECCSQQFRFTLGDGQWFEVTLGSSGTPSSSQIVTNSGSLTSGWESEPDLSRVLISHKTSWNYQRLNIPVAVLNPSTTGLGPLLTSQGQSKNVCIAMKVSDNFSSSTTEKSTKKRELYIYKGFFGNIYDPEELA